MNNKPGIYILLLLNVLNSSLLPCQSTFKEQFRDKASRMGLMFTEATEGRYTYKDSGANSLFHYDAKIMGKGRASECYVMLKEETGALSVTRTPHVEFTRMIANMASNDADHRIWARIMDPDEAARMGADWAAEARFVPKRLLSRNTKARLICLYKEGRGMASTLLCYKDTFAALTQVYFLDEKETKDGHAY